MYRPALSKNFLLKRRALILAITADVVKFIVFTIGVCPHIEVQCFFAGVADMVLAFFTIGNNPLLLFCFQ